MEHPLSRTDRSTPADSSVRGSLALACVLVGALLAISYPVFALGVVIGVVGTVVLSRLVALVDARRRSRVSRSKGRSRTRRSQPE
jgi:CHASE2 domain-containing sensor protein